MDLTKFGVKGGDDNSDKPKEVNGDNLGIDMNKIKKDFSSDEVERFLPWFLKYQLKSFDDLVETPEIKKVVNFIEKFKPGKGLLLHGPAGAGKTTTLNLVGEKYGFEVFEMNASDTRSKKSIEQSVGEVISQRSLFGKDKLILIDEVDGVSGSYDRGGVAQLAKFVKESSYPIVFTANDVDSDKIKPLKKVCEFVDFVNHSYDLLFEIGKRILISEDIEFKPEDLREFIELRSSSDIRGFINDLQGNVFDSKFVILGDLEIRDYKRKIEELMNKIFFSYPEDALRSNYNSDVNMDDLFLYLEENIPNVYDDKSVVLAFNEIAKADVFKGRIMKWQYWRYLVYINFYLTYGVSAIKGDVKKKVYKRNQRILKKWIYGNKVNALRPRTKAEKKKDMDLKFVERLAKFYGCSANHCRKRDLFYFAYSYQKDRDFRDAMDKKLDIDSLTKKALMEL